jgi:hypothetical protein
MALVEAPHFMLITVYSHYRVAEVGQAGGRDTADIA